jgi:hypothetical protein
VQVVAVDAAGHAGKSSQGVHGIEMAEQKNRFSGAPGKVDLQIVAEIARAVDAHASAPGLELCG